MSTRSLKNPRGQGSAARLPWDTFTAVLVIVFITILFFFFAFLLPAMNLSSTENTLTVSERGIEVSTTLIRLLDSADDNGQTIREKLAEAETPAGVEEELQTELETMIGSASYTLEVRWKTDPAGETDANDVFLRIERDQSVRKALVQTKQAVFRNDGNVFELTLERWGTAEVLG